LSPQRAVHGQAIIARVVIQYQCLRYTGRSPDAG